MERLTKTEACRFLLYKNGLLGPRRFRGTEGIVDFLREAGCVQTDHAAFCGKNHELTLLSRIDGITRFVLRDALYESRILQEYYDKGQCLILTEDLPCFAHVREQYRRFIESRQTLSAASQVVLAAVRQKGELASDEPLFPDNPSLLRTTAEALYYRGDLTITRREGSTRWYAADTETARMANPFPGEKELRQWLALRRISGIGLAWNMPGEVFSITEGFTNAGREQAFSELEAMELIRGIHVDGITLPLYLSQDDAGYLKMASQLPGEHSVRLLAPMDNLLWDRKLISALFGFSYRCELTSPPEKRTYGAYVLPVLYDDRFIGRIEPVLQDGKLHIRSFWSENETPESNRFWWALEDELLRLCRYLGGVQVVWDNGWQKTV